MSQFFIDLTLDRQERFDFSKFLQYLSDDFDPLTSYFLEKLQYLPTYSYKSVGALEGRIDLVSYAIYGSTQYWWILLEYNHIGDPENLPADTILAYPSLFDLEALYYQLKAQQSSRGL